MDHCHKYAVALRRTRVSSICQCKCLVSRSLLQRSKQHHFEPIHRTFEDVLADKEIELVVITTPSETHYALSKRALEAGKHGMPSLHSVNSFHSRRGSTR